MSQRRRGKELEQVNLLELIPVRLAEWSEVGGRSILRRPKPIATGLRGLVERLLHVLSASRIRLDAVGSFAWQHVDGKRTVGEIAESLRQEFGEQVAPAEERLGQLIRVFRREGLVAYRGWDDDLLNSR